MMKVVVPLRIQSMAAKFLRPDNPRVVEGAFRDDVDASIEKRALTVYGLSEFFKEVQSRVIEDGMHSIEAKGIDMKIGDPFDCIRDEKMAHFVAVRIVEVERLSPGCLISIGKIRTELRQIISFGTNVVIDNVKNHCKISGMADINQLF